jgi:sec-independent protein translocase protein TatB
MFDIGFFELLVLCFITLIVIGPSHIPSLIRKMFMLKQHFNTQFSSIKTSLNNELGITEIQQELHNKSILNDSEIGANIVTKLSDEMQELNRHLTKK